MDILLRPSLCTYWQSTGYCVCPFRDGPLPLCMLVGEGPILPAALARLSSSSCIQSSGVLPKLKFQPSYLSIYLAFLNQSSEHVKSSEEVVIDYWREYERIGCDYLRYYPDVFLEVLWKSTNIPSKDSWYDKSRFEPGTSRIHSFSATHSTVTFNSCYKSYLWLGGVTYS